MPHRNAVTFDLELTLRLTHKQATSDAFRARLRSALAHSTAREALSAALDVDVDRLALRDAEAPSSSSAGS
jgi:hypothetical protein